GAGILLALLGCAGTFYLVNLWREEGFGDLDPFVVMRVAIPSVTAITLGLQVSFAALFLSLVKWQIRSRSASSSPGPRVASHARASNDARPHSGSMSPRRRPWLPVVLVVAAMAAGCTAAPGTRRAVLRSLGQALVVEAGLEPADIIVVSTDADGAG